MERSFPMGDQSVEFKDKKGVCTLCSLTPRRYNFSVKYISESVPTLNQQLVARLLKFTVVVDSCVFKKLGTTQGLKKRPF